MGFLFKSKQFKEPLNTPAYTTTHVMNEQSCIVWVSHELDGDWQFMGTEPIVDYTKVALVVSLEQMIKRDRSILKVADLPMGYCATRNNKSDKWKISKIDYSAQEIKDFGYYCSKCGVYHKDIPMAYGADAPYQYYLIPDAEKAQRCILTDDQCVIDNSEFYIRGSIELNVENNDQKFRWNVWVLINREDYNRMEELWEDENRILEKPYYGRLATKLEPYPDTLNLPVSITTEPVGYIPKVHLGECNHPLYLEQENGIDQDRVVSFAKLLLSH